MTSTDFRSLSLQSPMPITLILQAEDGGTRQFVCREMLRVLPRRRVVARAWDGEREVVLKLFLGPHRHRYRDRESAGLEILRSAGVRTPEMLAHVRGPDLLGLVMDYLSDSEPVDATDQQQVAALVSLLAGLHGQGVRQKDLHLDNFLRHQGQLYAIDGDGVQQSTRPLERRRCVQNFAVLLAQLPPVTESWVEALSAVYLHARGWTDDLVVEVRQQLIRERQLRMKRYLRKTQRSCTEFVVSIDWRQKLLTLRDLDSDLVAQLLDDPDSLVKEGQTLKKGNSATVVRHTHADGTTYVLKRYNIKSFSHRLRRIFKPVSRARRAWCNGHRLHFMQIASARPLALLERRFGPLRGVAYLLLEDLGDLNLADEVENAGLSDARCEQVAQLFSLLRTIKVSHGDTKANNFIINGERVHLIDLDGMQSSLRRFDSDRERFLANWAIPERERFEAAFGRVGLL